MRPLYVSGVVVGLSLALVSTINDRARLQHELQVHSSALEEARATILELQVDGNCRSSTGAQPPLTVSPGSGGSPGGGGCDGGASGVGPVGGGEGGLEPDGHWVVPLVAHVARQSAANQLMPQLPLVPY